MDAWACVGADSPEANAMPGSMLEPCSEAFAFDDPSSGPIHVTGLCTRLYHCQRRITCFQDCMKHCEIFSVCAADDIGASNVSPVSVDVRVAVHQHTIITCYLAGPGMRVRKGRLGGVGSRHAVNKCVLPVDGG